MRISSGERVAEVRVGPPESSIDGRPVPIGAIVRDASARIEGVEVSGELVPVRVAAEGDRVFVWCDGRAWELRRAPEQGRSRGRAEGGLTSPMPGRVRKVLVAVGDSVAKGDVLLILEAMKMEHSIRAPREGRVIKIAFGEGDLVDAGVELVEIGDAGAPEAAAAPAASEDEGLL